jgi:hypothetical protein
VVTGPPWGGDPIAPALRKEGTCADETQGSLSNPSHWSLDMTSIRNRILTVLLAGLGGSAFAGVIMPIATSADGGYTATGPAHAMTAGAPDSRRMGAAPAKPAHGASIDLFRSADGSPMALGGAVIHSGGGSGWTSSDAGAASPMASHAVSRGNVE